MKKFIMPLFGALLLLSACIPPQQVNLNEDKRENPLPTATGAMVAIPISLPVEESTSSASIMTGTGAVPQRLAEHGIFEIGLADAPNILTVFTNLSCTYCNEFARQMLPTIEREFVATGKLRMHFAIVPLKKYPNSNLEASALLCATTFEKGQEMWDTLMNTKLRDRKLILALAKKLELSAKEFPKCLDAKETKTLLEEQAELIRTSDVTLIPTFILNGQKEVGLPTLPDLRGWIRANITP